MKQLGLGFMQYAQDYDERLPVGPLYVAVPAHFGQGWSSAIFPYVKSSQAYKCPSDSTVATSPKVPLSYGYNINIAYAINSIPGPVGKLAGFNATAKTVMMSEFMGSTAEVSKPGTCQDGTGNGSSDTWVWNQEDCSGADGSTGGAVQYATGYMGNRNSGYAYTDRNDNVTPIPGRHFSGANYLMVDGHVKWFMGSSVSSGWNALASTDAQDANAPNGLPCAQGTEGSPYAVTMSTR